MRNLSFTGSPEQVKTLAQYRKGESDLVFQDGAWFLALTDELPAPLRYPSVLAELEVVHRTLRRWGCRNDH